jgi:hypothetical protein
MAPTDIAKAAVKVVQRRERVKAALRQHPEELQDIWTAIWALEDRVANIENAKRGRYRDDAVAALEALLSHALDVIDDIVNVNLSADDAKKLLKRYVRRKMVEAAKSRGATDPKAAARMASKRHRPQKT